MADVCFKYNDGVVVRDKFDFGQFPIMLMVSVICLFDFAIVYFYFDSVPEDMTIPKARVTSMAGCFNLYIWFL